MGKRIHVVSDEQELRWRASEEFLRLALASMAVRGVFNVALSGGATPRGFYSLLGDRKQIFQRQIPWKKAHFFWSDERFVPSDERQSNYSLAWETLLSRAPIPPENIHRVPADLRDAAASAEAYERTLREYFSPEPGQPPRFDLILLGVGADGHIASLFPASPALEETEKLIVSAWDGRRIQSRVTMTYPILNQASNIMILLSGKEKAGVAKIALEGGTSGKPLPVQRLHPVSGDLIWVLDRDAAGLISADWAKQGPN